MKVSIVFIVLLFACGSITTVDSTVSQTRETCGIRVMRASTIITECALDKQELLVELEEVQIKLQEVQEMYNVCDIFRKRQQEKIYSCNIMVNVYESDLIQNGCTTAGATSEGEHIKGKVLGDN